MGLIQPAENFEDQKETQEVSEEFKIFKFSTFFLITPLVALVSWCVYLINNIISFSSSINNNSHLTLKEIFLNNIDIQIFTATIVLFIVFLYVAIVHFVKFSSVEFLMDKLIISEGILPWPGKKLTLKVSLIKSCRVESYCKNFDLKNNQAYFRVWITLNDSTERLVDKDIINYQDAKNLEYWISNFLHPKNKDF